jgi:inorganic pyrophosphatase
MVNERFWLLVDQLVASSQIVIDRPRGSRHPTWAELVYPLDYGFLAGTHAMDGGGIDVWRGSLTEPRATGAIVTIDLVKRDAEVKLLIGCTKDEMAQALAAHQSGGQAGLLVLRPLEAEPPSPTGS